MADKQPTQQASGFAYKSTDEQRHMSRDELIAYQRAAHNPARHDAKLALRAGESLFDIDDFEHLRIKEVESECQSLLDYGIDGKLLKGSSDESKRARAVIYIDGDPAKGFKHKATRVWPAIKGSAYADKNTLALAVIQWIEAVPKFNAASVWIGNAAFGRKDYNIDGSEMSETPDPAGAILKNALEKGCDLPLQGKANAKEVRPAAVRDAEAHGFSANGTPRAKAPKVDFEL